MIDKSMDALGWLREQLEGFVDAQLEWILFETPQSAAPRLPTAALSLLELKGNLFKFGHHRSGSKTPEVSSVEGRSRIF